MSNEFNKKAWLDYLYYVLGNQETDFKVAGVVKQNNNEPFWTKHYNYLSKVAPLQPWESNKIEWINQRGILKNELIIDSENFDNLEEIKHQIAMLNIPLDKTQFYLTGSRGYHIHIFFKSKISDESRKRILTYMNVDTLKFHGKTLIALENVPHWKSGKIKKEVKNWYMQKIPQMN